MGYISYISSATHSSWWRHQTEPFSALLAICPGNLPVTGEFPAQRAVTRSFYVFCAWINCWANNGDTGDLRSHRAHYDVTVMYHDLCSKQVNDNLSEWVPMLCSFPNKINYYTRGGSQYLQTMFHYFHHLPLSFSSNCRHVVMVMEQFDPFVYSLHRGTHYSLPTCKPKTYI